MNGDNYKNDFFEDQVCEKKARKPRVWDKYSRQRILPHVRVPVEYMIIILIVFLVAVIIAYAVGVERGKSSIHRAQLISAMTEEIIKTERQEAEEKNVIIGASSGEQILTEETVLEEEYKVSPVDEAAVERDKTVPDYEGVYILQVATFKSKSTAEKAKDKLKEQGLKPQILQKGQWYQVYLEGYKTIQEAEKAKKKIANEYSDCYIRKIK